MLSVYCGIGGVTWAFHGLYAIAFLQLCVNANMSFAVADQGDARNEPKFLHFNAVFRKNWSNSRLAPFLGVGAPPLGNPGSATDLLNLNLVVWDHKTVNKNVTTLAS